MTFEQFENPVQDLRYGLRQLWRSPGFSSLAILCLTLGIGANTAVFSWIEGIPVPSVPGSSPPGKAARHGRNGAWRDRCDRNLVAGLP
jgi:hypothetical protein